MSDRSHKSAVNSATPDSVNRDQVRCRRCGVSVPQDRINTPNRCIDPQCPLNKRG